MQRDALMKTTLMSVLALVAFAGNSVLCRLALSDQAVDPAGFTVIRLLSGIITLWPLLWLAQKRAAKKSERQNDQKPSSFEKGSWFAGLMLFLYAMLFSYAYVNVDTATGALILFGVVQISLLIISLLKGNRLQVLEVVGMLLALFGFAYLVLPELRTPSFNGLLMMSVAGIAWAFYTVAGQGSKNALCDTTYNFSRTLPFVLILLMVSLNTLSFSPYGLILAVLSGAVTSGLGYAIWYVALPNLTTAQAGVIQLFVPIIAAVGGVIFAGENITPRLIIAALLILGGITLVILGKKRTG